MGTINQPKASRRFANLKAVMALSVAGSVIVAGVVYQSSAKSNETSACVCSASNSYNPSLPASHPSNRCANQTQDLSWKSWLSGSSRTTQFHFLDLLELLHGHDNKPTERPSATQH
ncbi:hypothetical protein KJI95_12410 [Shewanella sp. JM162201]|uniref:Uncharacterized protein n=1 Tax=Shewanella jiangmenensis TaxID=2837387 RepID=A0ABS5V4E1_9GAMM|nr:hypothetical protein [Shewanella jiangmenensis]MBT1445326.1 hypothetical protein [Shewanella jiangmenensis]